MRKRILSLVLAVLMLLSVLPTTALAADSVDNATQIAEYKNGGGGGGGHKPDKPDKDDKENENKVYWKQFYGLSSEKAYDQDTGEYYTYGKMLDAENHPTKGKVTVYTGTGDNKKVWNATEAAAKDSLANTGITIVPAEGYYVKMVLIGCNDGGGYDCKTAQRDQLARLVFTAADTGEVKIDAAKLGSNATIDGKKVWHKGAGYPSYLMIWLGTTPNPAKVIYDAGEMTITDLVSYDKDNNNDTLQTGVTSAFSNNTITYTAGENQQEKIAKSTHSVLNINQTTATKDGKTYKFTGWQLQVRKEDHTGANDQWQVLNPDAPLTQAGASLKLSRDYKLVAQWEEDTTPKVKITVRKTWRSSESTDKTGGSLPAIPKSVTIQLLRKVEGEEKYTNYETPITLNADSEGAGYKTFATEITADKVDANGKEYQYSAKEIDVAGTTENAEGNFAYSNGCWWKPEVTTSDNQTSGTTQIDIANIYYKPLTVTKTAKVSHYEKKDNGDVDWSWPEALGNGEDENVKLGDKIYYYITVTNNTNEAITDVKITDIFNGTGELELEDGYKSFARLLPGEKLGEYTIELNSPLVKERTIALIYTVQFGDTKLTPAELTNKAKVTYNGTDYPSKEVKIPVDNVNFNLLVYKAWQTPYSTSPVNVTVTLYKGEEVAETKTIDCVNSIRRVLFENLPLADIAKYSVKETEIVGAEQPNADYTKFDVKENDKVIGTWTAEYTDTIKTNGRIQITNKYAPVDPITVTKTATVNRVEGASARVGDTITYTIKIQNNTDGEITFDVRDVFEGGSKELIDTSDGGDFTGNNGVYVATMTNRIAGGTATVIHHYTVDKDDGKGNDGYLKNTVTVTYDGKDYTDCVETEIEQEQEYTIYVPIVKTLKNEGTERFTEGAHFRFTITNDEGQVLDNTAQIFINDVSPNGRSTTGYNATWDGDHNVNGVDYSFKLSKSDYENLPVENGFRYVWISEVNGGAERMTYSDDKIKLYLIPDGSSAGPQSSLEGMLVTLATDGEVVLPNNDEIVPEASTYYALNAKTYNNDPWNGDMTEIYDFAAEFWNYYDKQEHKGNTVKVGPQLNRDDHVAYIMGYPDGNVRPEGEITRAEACTIFFRLLTEESRDYYFSKTNDYTDVKAGEWFNNAISTLSNAGIVTGYNDGTFRPNQPITRGEMAKIIANFANLNKGTKSFTDLSGHWSKTYVELAAGNGWIAGYPDGSFRPDQKITRAETVTMINRVLERVPAKESRLLSRSIMLTFPDNNPGDWYYIAMQEASNSHEYQRSVYETAGDEMWTKLIENVDWTKLER